MAPSPRGLNRWHLAAAAVAFPLAAAAAADLEPWGRWRGGDGGGQGGEARFPLSWTEADWRWTAALPGTGNASPVVWRERIYTASADEPAGKRFVTCHALADGRLLWSRELAGPIDPHHAQNSAASGSPAVDEAGCYWIWGGRAGLWVEAFGHDGRPRWRFDLGPFLGQHGFGATPAICRDLLIVPNDQDGESSVVALDTATGRERWRLPRDSAKAGYATPLVIDAGGDAGPLVVLASMAHGLTGVEAATGRVLWERNCLAKRAVSSPVRVGSLVLATSGDGGGDNRLVAVRLPVPADSSSEPEIAYTLDRAAAPYVPTPVGAGELVYLWGDRGVVTCIRAATGETVWRGRVGGNYSASPIAVGGTIRNVSAEGEAVAIRAGEAFEVLGRTDLGDTCRATPAVAGGRMVFRTAGRLLALDAEPSSHTAE